MRRVRHDHAALRRDDRRHQRVRDAPIAAAGAGSAAGAIVSGLARASGSFGGSAGAMRRQRAHPGFRSWPGVGGRSPSVNHGPLTLSSAGPWDLGNPWPRRQGRPGGSAGRSVAGSDPSRSQIRQGSCCLRVRLVIQARRRDAPTRGGERPAHAPRRGWVSLWRVWRDQVSTKPPPRLRRHAVRPGLRGLRVGSVARRALVRARPRTAVARVAGTRPHPAPPRPAAP